MRSAAGTPTQGADVLEVLRSIWEINHHLQTASKRMSKQLGITGPQRLALRMIGREPAMATLRLSALLHLHPSTVTGILDRLERDRLITRVADAEDARRSRLQLTARGRELNQVRSGTVESAVAAAIAQLSPATVSAGRELLNALCQVFQDLATRPSSHTAPVGGTAGRRRAQPRRRRQNASRS